MFNKRLKNDMEELKQEISKLKEYTTSIRLTQLKGGETMPRRYDPEDEEEEDEEEEEVEEEQAKTPSKSKKAIVGQGNASTSHLEAPSQTVLEREINLTLLNDKLNYIISLLQK